MELIYHYDGRTIHGRLQRQIEGELVSALGGDPSPQQILLLQRASIKAIRCSIIEHEILSKGSQVPPTLENHYLRFSRELREDLKTLGLNRVPKQVADLEVHLQQKYG